MDGASHRGELGIPLDRTSPSNLLTLTDSISFHAHTNLSWKGISGNTTGKWLRFSLPRIIVTDAEIKPQSWKSMTPWIKRRKTLSTITANFHNSTRHQEMITGTRALEPPITFCKSKTVVKTTCLY